jgi:glycosyltransferase involved in cell wall biosynthesis
MTLVTAAITTYNRAGFLPEAIASAEAQELGEGMELLVVDDGSTDETEQIVRRFGERARYVQRPNGGRSAARNTAIEHARGTYVAFLDSDDRWLPGKLRRQLDAFTAQPALGMVHGHVEVIDADGAVMPEMSAYHWDLFEAAHAKPVTYARYAFDCRCFSTAVMIPRALLEQLGGYDPALLLDDYDLYLRLALEAEIAFLHGAPLAQYRHHPGQMTSAELTTGQIQTCLKHLAILEQRDDVPQRTLAERNLRLMLARSYNVLGDGRAARGAVTAAIRARPARALDAALVRQLAASFRSSRRG